jgi:hypothetical protein
MTKDTALLMAIETLSWFDDRKYVFEAIQACKEALNTNNYYVEPIGTGGSGGSGASKEWQGLSDDEYIDMIIKANTPMKSTPDMAVEFGRLLEAKLREKNNG